MNIIFFEFFTMFYTQKIKFTCKEAAKLRKFLLSKISAFALEDFAIDSNSTMINSDTIEQFLMATPIVSTDSSIGQIVTFVCTDKFTKFNFPNTSGLDVEEAPVLPFNCSFYITGQCKIVKGTPNVHAKFSTFNSCTFQEEDDGIVLKIETQRKSVSSQTLDNLISAWLNS